MFRYKPFLITINFIIILFIIIYFIIGFDGLYGQDSYEYLRYTKALQLYFKTGIHPGDYFWPLYYPISGAILSFFLEPKIALQLLSIASLLVSSIYISKIITLLFDKKVNPYLYVLSLFTLSPIVFRLGITTMSDMLSTLFIVLSFYNAIIYSRHKTNQNLYAFLIFCICAIMTRYVAFVVLLPIGILTLTVFIRNRKHLKHIPLLLLCSVILLLPHFIIRSENSTQFLNHDWLTKWSFFNFFKSSFITVDGTSSNSLPNIIYAFSSLFHPRYLLIGILLFPFYIKTKIINSELKIILISFLTYNLFLAGIPFQNSRFLLLSFPLVIILLYPAFAYLLEKMIPTNKIKYFIIVLSLIQICLCSYSLKPILERNSLEKKIAFQIESYQQNTLYSFDIDVALQGRGLNFRYKNLWVKKYTSFEKNALVLFHPTKFKQQWKDKNPILNWNNLNYHYNLKIIEELPNGWKLYKIQNEKDL